MTYARYARNYIAGDRLPPMFPWEQEWRVASIEYIDSDHLTITAVSGPHRKTFHIHPDNKFETPRREDGSTVDWGEHDPAPDEIAVGDKWRGAVVAGMAAIHWANLDRVRVKLLIGGRQHFVNAMRGQPMQGRTIREVRHKPKPQSDKAGPYKNVNEEEVWFAIHPSGHGRWSPTIPVFDSLGKGLMRPPTKPVQFSLFTFAGENKNDRHPRDPLRFKVDS